MATILLVDDHAVNREFLIALLSHQGHRLIEAADGTSALHIATSDRPDLVISDILMPSGDGYELARGLRETAGLGEVPIIFYTAHYNEREAVALAESCGVRYILTKPAEPERVLRVVEEALSGTVPSQLGEIGVPSGFTDKHLRLISDKLVQTTEELEWTTSRLIALVEMNLELSGERDPARLVRTFCRWTRDLIAARHAVVLLGDGDEQTYLAANGMSDEDAAIVEDELRVLPACRSPPFDEQEAFRLAGGGISAESVGLPSTHPPIENFIAASVRSPTRRFGWVAAANKLGLEAFSADDERLLSIFAAHLGRIFENHCLLSEVSLRSQELEAEMARRTASQARVEVQYAVASILAEKSNIEEAAQEALCAICAYAGFELGEVWEIDASDERLRHVATWHSSAEAGRAFSEALSRQMPTRGVSIIGEVWKTGISSWIPHLRAHEGFLRHAEAEALGLVSAFVLPIFGRGQMMGMLGLFGKLAQRPDEEAVNLFKALGSQIGQFLERRSQQQRIVRLARIQAVLGATNALMVRVTDMEGLLEGACQVATEEGGFVRAEAIAIKPAGERRRLAVSGLPITDPPASDLIDEAITTRQPTRDNALLTAAGTGSRVVLPLLENDEVRAVLLLDAGRPDFFTPDEMALVEQLCSDISFALDSVSSRLRLARLAYYDGLTGLPNRTLFLARLRQYLNFAREEGRKVFVAVGNIRNFSSVNTTFGRHAGDLVLREVAQRLQAASRFPDHLARISGNEFGKFLLDPGTASGMALRAEQILERGLSESIRIGTHEINLTAQAGIALFPDDGTDEEALLACAETALGRARLTGARVSFFEPRIQDEVARRMALESMLSRAGTEGEFFLHYQPKTDLHTGHIVGLEALLRWRRPDGGIESPNVFIPVLEETGRIIDVGMLVIRTALEDQRRWALMGLEPVPVAVNVSAVQLQEEGFVEAVLELLRAGPESEKQHAPRLDIEITETAMMNDLTRISRDLEVLRHHGIAISIDDFGTGYSSLGYLAQLPVSALKIDRSFVATMLEKADSRMIVSAVISLAHSLNLVVIAEGVETREQAALLKALSCDQMQGYLVSRPVDSKSIEGILPKRFMRIQ